MYVSEIRPEEKLQNICFVSNILKKFLCIFLPIYYLVYFKGAFTFLFAKNQYEIS